MNIQISKNRFFNALCILMLFSAAVHMMILVIVSFSAKEIYYLNYFNILSFSYFFPGFLDSIWGNAFSFIFAAALYFIILRANKK